MCLSAARPRLPPWRRRALRLDAPFNGLAPVGVLWIRGFLRGRGGAGRAVLVSSHLMSELEDTAEAWRSALDELRPQQAPAHLRPYAGLRLGQHLVAGRERNEAKHVLATASAEAVALGSALLADRIGALSQRAGFVVAPPPEQSPVAGLTPREIEVLQLVAAGRSNGEIGTALFISTKTASVHVSNILAKLGVNGRGEAAAIAHRIGLTQS